MAKKLGILVDTDIFIEYFNHRLFRDFFESGRFQIYYSVVTKKELLSKNGLSSAEQKTIKSFLKKYRMLSFSVHILNQYSLLRRQYRHAEKEDCLIAATAMIKKLPLVTRNYRHFKIFKELKLYFHIR